MNKFCPTCEDFREFKIESRMEIYTLRDEKIEIMSDLEICLVCGESLYDESREVKLMERIYQIYRNRTGMEIRRYPFGLPDRKMCFRKIFDSLSVQDRHRVIYCFILSSISILIAFLSVCFRCF